MSAFNEGHGKCSTHGGARCDVPEDAVLDCFMTGMPCQAWTRQRDRSSAGQVANSSHRGWKVTFSDYFDILDTMKGRIRGGISEQVMGFAEPDTRSTIDLDGYTSPLKLFQARLRERGFYSTTLKLNMGPWLDQPPRDRLYVIWVGDALGGAAAATWIQNAIQDFARR
jgi:hypothetical protein